MGDKHKISISLETLKKMTPAMFENLHKNNVEVVLPNGDMMTLNPEELEILKECDIIVEDEYPKEPKEPEIVVPYTRLEKPVIIVKQPKHFAKPYIPRTIGKPNARKKGGR